MQLREEHDEENNDAHLRWNAEKRADNTITAAGAVAAAVGFRNELEIT